MPQRSLHILSLPTELHHLIIGHLQFPDTAHFRATCAYFASLVPIQSSNYLDLVAANDSAWAVKRRRLACVFCARMRPASAFTDMEKDRREDWRSCYECSILEFGDQARLYPDRDIPRNSRMTRFTDNRKKLTVDNKETGLCTWCHNRFGRWGNQTGARGLCRDCFQQHPREAVMYEQIRFDQDLSRMGTDCVLHWSQFCSSELWETLEDDVYDWCNTYEWDYPPKMVPVWRGGKRGVTVRTEEEAKQLYFEVELRDWCSREEVAEVVHGAWN